MIQERGYSNNSVLTPERLGFLVNGDSLQKEIKGQTYTITPLKGMAALSKAVELQQQVWELPDIEVCPPHMWVSAIDTGGHVLGVKNEADELVAFVAGFGGYDHTEGVPFVLSDMAAVKQDLRDLNIGFALKLAQAIHVSEQGVSEVRWTYDPLRSRNAHLNLHKLGAVATGFYVDKYGDALAGSQNAEVTDRFMVKWRIDKPETQGRLLNGNVPTPVDNIPVVSVDNYVEDSRVALEIPLDIDSLAPEDRLAEQLNFRRLAMVYISELGYRATDYAVTNDQKGYYILDK